MTNYDPYEQDRLDNAVGQHDEDFGQRTAYDWEWEPTAIDRKNRLIATQRIAQATVEAQAAIQSYRNKPSTGEWLSIVGLGLLLLIAILFGLLGVVPPAHGQERLPAGWIGAWDGHKWVPFAPEYQELKERLPAFESQFTWAQATWSQSQNQWCIDAQPKDAGPGEMVGACADNLRDAERAVMVFDGQTDSRPEGNMSVDNRPDMPEAKIDSTLPVISWKEPTTPYWDRTSKLLVASMVTVGSFDLAQTCHSIANGGREVWMPMKSCGSLVGVGIAMGIGMTYLSYELHRHGHHRLERIPFIGMIAGNSAGIAYSKKNGAW